MAVGDAVAIVVTIWEGGRVKTISLICRVLALLALPGCIFSGGGSAEDSGVADVAVRDSARDVGDGGATDIGEGRDVLADRAAQDMDAALPRADADADAAIDAGPPTVFEYRLLPTPHVLVPLRPAKLDGTEGIGTDTRLFLDHLRFGWSATLTYEDNTLAMLSFDAVDMVLLTTDGSRSGDLLPPFDNPPAPMVVTDVSLFNDTAIAETSSYDSDRNPTLRSNSNSALGIGLPPEFQAFHADQGVARWREEYVPTADIGVTTLHDNPGGVAVPRPVLFGLFRGSPIMRSMTAAGHRVGVGLADSEDFNRWGWYVMDLAYSFSLNEAFVPQTKCVIAHVEGSSFGYGLASRLRRNGCEAAFSPNLAADLPGLGTGDVVVLTPESTADAVLAAREHAGPVIVLFEAPGPLSVLGMSEPRLRQTQDGREWVLEREAPPGLRMNREGSVVVTTEPFPPRAADPGAIPNAAIAVASAPQGGATFYLVEGGELLVDAAPAAGDRVALGMTQSSLPLLTDDALALMDAAIQWAVYRTLP